MKRRAPKPIIDDDEMDDADDMPLWVKKPRSRKFPDDQLGPAPVRNFNLAPHHVLCLSGFNSLIHDQIDPSKRQGFVVLTSPDGFPVARLHRDLKPGEVSWVLR